MNFAEVYRAAFAERDPDRKLVLLSEVRQAIRTWERADEPTRSTALPVCTGQGQPLHAHPLGQAHTPPGISRTGIEQ